MPKSTGEMVLQQITRAELAKQTSRGAEEVPLSESDTILAISRQLGSGGKQIAELVAQRLGWSLWDRDLVEAIAEDANVATRVVEHFDEKTVTELDALAHALAGDYEVSGFLFRRHLARALLAISKIGHAVIIGRGANLILRDSLSVRIVASREFRINMLRKRGLTPDQAREEIRRSDNERAGFVRKTFGRDIDDPTDYDLVVRTDDFGVEGAASLVIAAIRLRSQQRQPTR